VNKKINPSVLLLSLIFLSIFCFALYFSAHPVSWPNIQSKTESTKIATVSGYFVQVEKVVDGDTINVVIDGHKTAVRFIGINAPETYQGKSPECFAEDSFQYVKNRIEGQQVSLIADATQENKDKYERLLRYIILGDGTNLNLELIQKGYAREYTYKIPYQYQQEFRDAQVVAKTNTLGLWKACYK